MSAQMTHDQIAADFLATRDLNAVNLFFQNLPTASGCITPTASARPPLAAKLDAALAKIKTLEARAERRKMQVAIRLRDPLPEITAAELCAEFHQAPESQP